MTFLNQALLFGMFAVSIPIIIHLLNRRRFKKVTWAAMRFLNVSVEQNQRRMKLEDLLLLLLRCALLALLAFAVARPVVEGFSGSLPGSKVAAAVVLDTSASMRTAEGEGTRLDQAREAARAVVESLPPGSSVAISTSFHPDEPTSDLTLARQRIEEAPQTDRHADDLLGVLQRAAATLEGQAAAEKEIYLITDGHAEEWASFAAREDQLKEMPSGTKVNVVFVGNPAANNLGIARVTPSRSLPAVNQPFRIDLEVTNFGSTAALDVPVSLLIDEQVAGEPWIIDEIAPGRSASATLYATLPSPGFHRVTLSLAGDAVPFDDQRTIVLQAVEDVRVLLVDGEPGVEAGESETFFLRHALAPVPEEMLASYPVKPTVVPVSDFAEQNLSGFDAVVLANVSDLSPPVADRVAAHVEDGGGLVIFAGENIRKEFYNTLMEGKHNLLPATFISYRSEEEREPLSLQVTETNPLGLDEDMFASAEFGQAFRVQLAKEGSRIALRFSDGSPALVEREVGLGKVFLFSSTADTGWNNLAVKPAFVPLVNRLLGAIVQNQDAGLNIRAGEELVHRVAPDLAGKEVTVSEIGDPQALGRLITIGESTDETVLRFSETHRAGAYQAAIEGDMPVFFSVEPSARESTLALLESEQVGRLQESAKVFRWTAASGAGDFGSGRKGTEIWLPILFLVIGIAVLEMALAQWFSRSK